MRVRVRSGEYVYHKLKPVEICTAIKLQKLYE